MKMKMVMLAGLAMAIIATNVYALTFKIHNATGKDRAGKDYTIKFVPQSESEISKWMNEKKSDYGDFTMGSSVTIKIDDADLAKMTDPAWLDKDKPTGNVRYLLTSSKQIGKHYETLCYKGADGRLECIGNGRLVPTYATLQYLYPKDGKQYRIYFDTDGKTLKFDEADCATKDCLESK